MDESGIFHCRYHFTMFLNAHIALCMNGIPVGGRSSETYSRPIDVIMIIIIIISKT
jgi:hypothetical protein